LLSFLLIEEDIDMESMTTKIDTHAFGPDMVSIIVESTIKLGFRNTKHYGKPSAFPGEAKQQTIAQLTHHDECLITDYATVADHHRTPVRILSRKVFYGIWEASDIHNIPFIAPTVRVFGKSEGA